MTLDMKCNINFQLCHKGYMDIIGSLQCIMSQPFIKKHWLQTHSLNCP